MAHLRRNATGSPEANQKMGAVFVTDSIGFAHLPGDDHGPAHRRSWRLLVNAATLVLLVSCVFAFSGFEAKAEDASHYSKLGKNAYTKGQYQKAIRYFEMALADYRGVLGEKHPSTATGYNNLGLAWKSLGQYQKAIGYYEKALARIFHQ